MQLVVYNDDLSITKHDIKEEFFSKNSLKNSISLIASASKEQNALDILHRYFSGAKSILFDGSNKTLKDELDRSHKKLFEDKEFSFLYYTSGSTGYPVAALKSKQNIDSELDDLNLLFRDLDIKRAIVTVPFIHIYGSLFGLFYPLRYNLDIVLKEHFLPNDLLELIDDGSLVITTPLYIKALNKLSSSKDLSHSLFVSSTAPLASEDAKEFCKKFNSNIVQIFGSTETGGIAYKYNDEELWSPLKSVKVSQDKDSRLIVSSPYISDIIFEKEFKKTDSKIQTFDFIELVEDKFRLIGRSSQILKIAGKRYSTLQIEAILERVEGIEKALVLVNSNNSSLRGEFLDITLETQKHFSAKDIQTILKQELSNLKFLVDLKLVDKIKTSITGKKLALQ